MLPDTVTLHIICGGSMDSLHDLSDCNEQAASCIHRILPSQFPLIGSQNMSKVSHPGLLGSRWFCQIPVTVKQVCTPGLINCMSMYQWWEDNLLDLNWEAWECAVWYFCSALCSFLSIKADIKNDKHGLIPIPTKNNYVDTIRIVN